MNDIKVFPIGKIENDEMRFGIKLHSKFDRIENSSVPGWCGYWLKSYEESGTFDWSTEFNI